MPSAIEAQRLTAAIELRSTFTAEKFMNALQSHEREVRWRVLDDKMAAGVYLRIPAAHYGHSYFIIVPLDDVESEHLSQNDLPLSKVWSSHWLCTTLFVHVS